MASGPNGNRSGARSAGGRKSGARPDGQGGTQRSLGSSEEINRMMFASTTAPELLEVCDKHMHQLDAVHMSTALHKLAKSGPVPSGGLLGWTAGDSQSVQNLLDRACTKILTPKPTPLASTACGAAKLHIINERLPHAVESAAIQRLSSPNSAHLTNSARAFAKTSMMCAPLFEASSAQMLQLADNPNPQDSSGIAQAHATSSLHPEERVLESTGLHSASEASLFRPQDLSNSAQAFASLSYHNSLLAGDLAPHPIRQIGELATQATANIGWELSKSSCANPALMRALPSAGMQEIDAFSSQEASNMMRAVAKAIHFKQCPLVVSLTAAGDKVLEAKS
ncbi:unnamed protein product [Polarella glacialis]|uniref:Uncharacterized protein n=1 Tax=Polarella glacialis TaxID=89957 RepID=A0A813FJ90_POLGL|nr:unnamed protein product [Polarella glacialis]